MKKNLLSIIILALLIVNIALTAIMMFSVTSASKKTISLVDDIASVLSIEIGDQEAEVQATTVPIENVITYDIADQMTVMLRKGTDEKTHYAVLSVSFLMDSKDKAYKKFGAELDSKQTILKDAIIEVVGSYTLEEAEQNIPAIKTAILTKIQSIFDSKFIFDVAFGDGIIFQ